MMNEYAQRVLDIRKAQAPWEAEYLQSVTEVFESIGSVIESDPRLEKNKILERITVPERIVSFQVPLTVSSNFAFSKTSNAVKIFVMLAG